ncbi:hypothetical protein [Deinococcus sp. QL22]|uniref:hypothetical protein n=1 Tax=Deinococcus sp. QL22 TaxID=2939437 RepID=UPI0020178DE4|nr:hypothetical protein [Deinococcus sp. QL22]UQN10368.1 hypothetical protein M1R55_29900 [Deinococcus sp. QL22]UQN10502.1 hypothetical protein M1R55_29225 [Deinococcus sp. QL22]
MNSALIAERVRVAFVEAGVVLGVATFPGGQTADGLTVGDWPEGTTVTGLEVIISANPRQRVVPAFAFLGFQTSFPIRLVNQSGQEDLEAAVNAIAEAFWPLADDPALLEESRDYPEQVTLAVTAD